MVICQSSLLPSSGSSIRACSEVGRSRNVSDLNLGPHLGSVVNNNAASIGVMLFFFNINSHPSWQPRTNILNSIFIVKSMFSASLQHHLFMNLKYLWSSMLLQFFASTAENTCKCC